MLYSVGAVPSAGALYYYPLEVRSLVVNAPQKRRQEARKYVWPKGPCSKNSAQLDAMRILSPVRPGTGPTLTFPTS